MSAPDHVLALFVYLGVAIVTARLVSRVRSQTDEALAKADAPLSWPSSTPR